MNEEKNFKTISDINDYKFIIKNYQRGYRWDSKQVENLLDDLLEFEESNKELYSLQRIIVRKLQENEYELIDGQQRLTTIYILLKFLKVEKIYKIEYENREESKEFLENINNMHQENIDNLDFIFMKNAYETIEKWFKITSKREETGALKARFRILLLKKIANGNVKFIWDEIKDPNISSKEIFLKTNVKMKKISVIGIGGSGCEIIKTLEENYKFNDNIKIIGSDSATCGMEGCKNKLPLERVYPIYCKVKGILENKDKSMGDIMCCIGCNCNPILGELSAAYKYNEIKKELNGVDKLILTTVLGGGTGTGAIKEFAKVAKELNIDTTCFISMPIYGARLRDQMSLEAKEKLLSMGIDVINNEVPENISISDFPKKIDIEIAQKIAEQYLKEYIIV